MWAILAPKWLPLVLWQDPTSLKRTSQPQKNKWQKSNENSTMKNNEKNSRKHMKTLSFSPKLWSRKLNMTIAWDSSRASKLLWSIFVDVEISWRSYKFPHFLWHRYVRYLLLYKTPVLWEELRRYFVKMQWSSRKCSLTNCGNRIEQP